MEMRGESRGVATLVKETVDGLGHLVAEHLRLSRLELLGDLSALSHHVAFVVAASAVATVGYFFLWLGVLAVLAPRIGLASAALLIGGGHLAGGAVGLKLALGRLRRARALDATIEAVEKTVSGLSAVAAREGSPDAR